MADSWTDVLRREVELAAQRALCEQNANLNSPTCGCFDRRHWSWKLVDFPEATFQRNVLPLALLFADPNSALYGQPHVLVAIENGLSFARRIQHRNGSFDQAFPWEQSFGATAFLLQSIIETLGLVADRLSSPVQASATDMAQRAAEFLCRNAERHGEIANHLAGASAALFHAADRFGDSRFEARASELLDRVIAGQSGEGWFREYDGADPGYQTLCMEYLARIEMLRPSSRLRDAIDRALDFMQWFVHPDGTVGGLYGSRRTSIAYPGGFARLGATRPVAHAIHQSIGDAIARGRAIGPATIDVGNLAPLLTSVVHAVQVERNTQSSKRVFLPWQHARRTCDFPDAGFYVRSNEHYYVVCGASNGGTLLVFDRMTRRAVRDDGGYVAELGDGTTLTSQITDRDRVVRVADSTIEVEAPFFDMPGALPTPAKFLLLRVVNLTVMRSITLGNWIKRQLVDLLITGKGLSSLHLVRKFTFDADSIQIEDTFENRAGLNVRRIEGGVPFEGIHMASAGYVHPGRLGMAAVPARVDVESLVNTGTVRIQTVI